jgi:hypothetical protein
MNQKAPAEWETIDEGVNNNDDGTFVNTATAFVVVFGVGFFGGT